MTRRSLVPVRLAAAAAGLAALGACSDPLDFDMRGRLGGSVDTSQAAQSATAARPAPDDRGVISYPTYQVAVARRGDMLSDVAGRVGLPAGEVARYNGIRPDDRLRDGEVIALPRRVTEPSPATGAIATGPIRPAGNIDITTLAGSAIDRAAPTGQAARQPAAARSGVEPVRHRVERGETAFTIARLYDVTPRALAEWNGLDGSFSIREGQYLLIPVALPGAAAPRRTAAAIPAPGAGSPTPEPPSASRPLPAAAPPAAAAPEPRPAAPAADIGQPTRSSDAAMAMPVQGRIIREFAKGRNEGVDFGAAAGTPVKAAAAGQVAAITRNTDNVNIVVVRHPDDLLTVYTHIDGLTVEKGDQVSRGQTIGAVRAGTPAFLHFEVRKGFESTDPMPYLR